MEGRGLGREEKDGEKRPGREMERNSCWKGCWSGREAGEAGTQSRNPTITSIRIALD
jgi:hypothetical protein